MAILATGRSAAVLAQAGDTLSLFLNWILLVAALLVGAAVIALATRWRKRQDTLGTSPSDQLAHFRSLYEQGAISQEEFNRLRGMLGSQLRAELNVNPKSTAPEKNARPGPPQLPPAAGLPPPTSPPVNGTGPP